MWFRVFKWSENLPYQSCIGHSACLRTILWCMPIHFQRLSLLEMWALKCDPCPGPSLELHVCVRDDWGAVHVGVDGNPNRIHTHHQLRDPSRGSPTKTTHFWLLCLLFMKWHMYTLGLEFRYLILDVHHMYIVLSKKHIQLGELWTILVDFSQAAKVIYSSLSQWLIHSENTLTAGTYGWNSHHLSKIPGCNFLLESWCFLQKSLPFQFFDFTQLADNLSQFHHHSNLSPRHNQCLATYWAHPCVSDLYLHLLPLHISYNICLSFTRQVLVSNYLSNRSLPLLKDVSMKVEVLTMIGNTMQTIQFMFAGHSCVEFRANAFGVAAYQQWEDYKGANLCTFLW